MAFPCLAWSCLQGIPSLPELKLRYYDLMIVYHEHYHNYLEICRCYKAIYESDGVQADPAQWQPVSQAKQGRQVEPQQLVGGGSTPRTRFTHPCVLP